MKDYVMIQSNIDIVVTAGLQYRDVTDPKLNVADKLRINPLWQKCKVLIRKGQHVYPSEIIKWSSVQSLEESGHITIGKECDANGDIKPEIDKDTLIRKENEINATQTKPKKKLSKDPSLSEIGDN